MVFFAGGNGAVGAGSKASSMEEVGSCRPNAADAGYPTKILKDKHDKLYMTLSSVSGWNVDDRWETKPFEVKVDVPSSPACKLVFKAIDERVVNPKGARIRGIRLTMVLQAEASKSVHSPIQRHSEEAKIELTLDRTPLQLELQEMKCTFQESFVQSHCTGTTAPQTSPGSQQNPSNPN